MSALSADSNQVKVRPLALPNDPLKQALANCIRAVSGSRDLEVSFGAGGPRLSGGKAYLPDLPSQPSVAGLAVSRGVGDSMALRAACHDPVLHRRMAPEGHSARAVFDAAEQARVEAIGANRMQGVADNLAAMIDDRFRRAGLDIIVERARAPLADAISLLVRERLTGQLPPPSARAIVDLWRPWLEEKAPGVMGRLADSIDNQGVFGDLIREFISSLEIGDTSRDTGAEDFECDAVTSVEGREALAEDLSFGEPDSEVASGEHCEDEGAVRYEAGEVQRLRKSWPDDTNAAPYRPYTVRFDETVRAEDLCDTEELTRLRNSLDMQLAIFRGTVSRLANRLQRRLLAQQARSWDFDQEEGVLDAARLHRVVTDPMQPLSFKVERDTGFHDTVVTLLLDNSGSMRGRPITATAISADILARTLERCGVKTEILGFTTRAFNGGQSRQAWLQAGEPANPGRLNELRHIIYKSAGVPWRRAKKNLGLLLREGMLKENIDGEALAWAHARLLARPEERRILMMISDGSPIDRSTLSANTKDYLDRHLLQVIEEIETRSPIQLIAIGIGHDVTRYYRRAVTITKAEELGDAMTEKLAELFEQVGPSMRHRAG